MDTNFNNWPSWPKNHLVLIAEIGLNHGGDCRLAWKMIESAHNNGADFVKLQTFSVENFLHPSLPYFKQIKDCELSIPDQKKLFTKAKKFGIKLITTPFDQDSVDIAEAFSPCAYKVASMDINNLPLLRFIALKQRPVIVSCGMADLKEIVSVERIMREAGNHRLVLMHCISSYPAGFDELDLDLISVLKNKFHLPVGFSDHSLGLFGSFMAVCRGAQVIEKHFTIDRSLHKKYPQADNNLSIGPGELNELRQFCNKFSLAMSKPGSQRSKKGIKQILNSRRGFYARKDIKAGEVIGVENTVLLRPVKGIEAGDYDRIIGRKCERGVRKSRPIKYSDIKT